MLTIEEKRFMAQLLEELRKLNKNLEKINEYFNRDNNVNSEV